CTMALMSAATAYAQQPADDEGGNEIIVTAQKRSEAVQDVPVSLAVLSTEALQQQGVQSLNEMAKVVPGLVMIGGGGAGKGQAAIRGIASGADRNPLVGLYLDNVYVGTSSPRTQRAGFSFDPSLIDVERVEVLKGPQSTLY